MTIRKFVSKAGSTVTITTKEGRHFGAVSINWDWVEEGVCCDAEPDFNFDYSEPAIDASCQFHEDESWHIPLTEVFD